MRAAGDVRDKLLAIAAHLFEAATDDLELADGHISVLGSPDKSFTIREVATAAYWGPRPADMDPALIATRSYDPPETYSNACIAVVVEVDAETGQVQDRAHRRRRGLRHGPQPGRGRGAGDRRDRAGHRRGAVRAAALRRGRQLPRRHARGLPLPDRARGAGDRGRPPRDAVAGHRGRHEGHGRGRPDRRALRDRQRHLGRARRAGGSHAAAALRRARARRRRALGASPASRAPCGTRS